MRYYSEFLSYYLDMYKTTEELTALQFFWKNSRSIEILKEGNLQRIRFRVKDYVRNFFFFFGWEKVIDFKYCCFVLR